MTAGGGGWPLASVLITLIISVAVVRAVRWWSQTFGCDCEEPGPGTQDTPEGEPS